MGNRHDELNVAATVATHFLLGNLYTATVADDALIANAFVLAAGTFIVSCGTEDALAEQTVALWLIRAIVDGLGLGDLTIRIFQDFLWRCQSDGYLGKIILYLYIFFESHISEFSIFSYQYSIRFSRVSH